MTPRTLAIACFCFVGCGSESSDTALHTGDTEFAPSSIALCEGAVDDLDLRLDCDHDGIPDEETLTQFPDQDQDQDGTLDRCQSPRVPVLYGRENYVSYQPGSLPVVLLAPHGGSIMPEEIPARESSPPADAYTYELALAVADALEFETGFRPHLVACHLHRSRLDCNRSLSVGAEDNLFAQQAWQEFHAFTEQAKASAIATYGQAMVLDLHGMTRDRIEIGTLISGSQLLVGDSRLDHDAYAIGSSIRQLASQSGRSFSSISRGPLSLGSELETRGYEVVPSPGKPDPGTDEEGSALDYYEGGYNTVHHGSRHGGHSDAIQIEHPMAVRETPEAREAYAADLSASIVSFFEEMSGISLAHPTGIRLVALGSLLSETGEEGLLRVVRTGDVSAPLTLSLRSSGEALASSDLYLPDSVSFNPGDHVVDIAIAARDDAKHEGPEHFSIRLEEGSPVQILGESAEFWIADDESPSLWIHEESSSLIEGQPFSLLLTRDFCSSTEELALTWGGEVTEEDFDPKLPETFEFEQGRAQLAVSLQPVADSLTEGAEDITAEAWMTSGDSQELADWSNWLMDGDLPEGLAAWWDFSHPTEPETDRVAQASLLRLPSSSPPPIESNPMSSPPHWLAFDGNEDVVILESFPSTSSKRWWLEFQFRARPEATNDFLYLWSHGGVGARSSLNIYLTSDGILRTGFRGQDDDWSYTHLDINASLLDGEWHSYRLEIDWESTEARVFLDSAIGATAVLGAGGYGRTDHVMLGGRSDLRESRHFWGDMAEIRFGVDAFTR